MGRAAAERPHSQPDGGFATAILHGLSAGEKRIPCRFLYDERGSDLFERITRLAEYYPTRTEIGLLERHAKEISTLAGPGRVIVEFGSGSSRKTRILLDQLAAVRGYVAIDISGEALDRAASELACAYPHLTIVPLHQDFTRVAALPRRFRDAPKLGFFPGSTIGNLDLRAAEAFLAHVAGLLGERGALLIGVDLDKDARILLPAYDDPGGITASFSLNLLQRINRELGGDFDVRRFAHEAVYDREAGKISIYLVSLADQEVRVLGRRFRFRHGERTHIEDSHKYSIRGFARLARRAGWRTERVWIDDDRLFSVHYLRRR